MGSPFLHFALGCSHLPENSILFINRPFSAQFSNYCNSLNFEAKINFNTTRQNDLKWRKTCTGLKFDLMHFNGPQTKFIRDSLYKHPVNAKYFCKSFCGIVKISKHEMWGISTLQGGYRIKQKLRSLIQYKTWFCTWLRILKTW